MPSWPARLTLGSPQSSRPSPVPKSQGPSNPSHNQQPLARSPHQDPPLHGVPVLASPSLPTRRGSEQRPHHARSHSNPFAAMFGLGDTAARADGGPEPFNGHNAIFDSPLAASRSNGAAQNMEKDLVNGNCATCATVVRWPRNLDVFRCTVCLMINDLKPTLSVSGESRIGGNTPSRTAPTSPADYTRVPYISMDRTLDLIDECINVYLPSRLKDGINIRAQSQPLPSRSDGNAPQSPSPTTSRIPTGSSTSATDDIGHKMPSPTRAPPPPPDLASQLHLSSGAETAQHISHEPQRSLFRPLENYIFVCFSGAECLNASFLTSKFPPLVRAASESAAVEKATNSMTGDWFDPSTPFPELDAKTLLLGDFAENGTWWAGKASTDRQHSHQASSPVKEQDSSYRIDAKSPRINWRELNDWYSAVTSAGSSWRAKVNVLAKENPDIVDRAGPELFQQIEEEIAEARAHVQRTIFKASENLLRRPARPLRRPEDCRFLLILLANPLLYSSEASKLAQVTSTAKEQAAGQGQMTSLKPPPLSRRRPSASNRRFPSSGGSATGRHSGVIKRILGLLSTLPIECHQYLISWFSRFEEPHFRRIVELIESFVSYRLLRHHGRKRSNTPDPSGFMIPNISGPGAGTSAQLHAALGATTTTPKAPEKAELGEYSEDWQVKAAARTMSLLFSANNNDPYVKPDIPKTSFSTDVGRTRAGSVTRKRAHRHGQLLPTNAFYNTLLDYADLIADFEAWESRKLKFSFCQYPMFLSIWAKIRIMEHDARRQMEIKAREAFFDSIMSRKAVNQYLVLKVRRECLVEDSLRGVSEVVGTGQEEIKKGLRIDFIGEEGLDSGGLRKEWFLLLVREIFDQEHGLFVYDEDSHYCYFNPNTFETSDQFFLVGVLLGLAIYNSTILDVALPPFAFRKLLASAPNYTGPTTSTSRPTSGYSLDDLAEYRPTLAHGLRQLLAFEGDVEATFCRDFVVVVDRYGQHTTVPLCSNGDKRPVTNFNRREFVDLYVRYLLDSSVARQYEPFKRGFFTVCGGNALSLFRPEEIELLIRGSEEALDVAILRTVAIYENWGKEVDAASEPVVTWFWEAFSRANAKDQRKLLSFITASDRIPAMGATSLVIKIICLGEHQERFPIARTCFNMIALYKYPTREILEDKLWRAVAESEGFGMK